MPEWIVALLVGVAMIAVSIVTGLLNNKGVQSTLSAQFQGFKDSLASLDQRNDKAHMWLAAQLEQERRDRELGDQNERREREAAIRDCRHDNEAFKGFAKGAGAD